jgi:hypothetical protein
MFTTKYEQPRPSSWASQAATQQSCDVASLSSQRLYDRARRYYSIRNVVTPWDVLSICFFYRSCRLASSLIEGAIRPVKSDNIY